MSSVLYDALGPRAKRRITISTIVIAAVLAGIAFIVFIRLQEQGQLTAAKWGPIVNPSDPAFKMMWPFLLGGLVETLKAAAVAIVLSLVLGTLLAISRITAAKWYRWSIVGFVELFRGVPVVLSIFFASRVLPEVGISLPVFWYIIIGLTLYNSVVIAEVIRAGVAALPKGQSEAAMAIGLTRGQMLRLIILPQAFRLMLPVLIGQLVVVVKDTSLGFIISFEELLRRGQIAVQTLHNPLQMFLLIAAIFIIINYTLSKVAERVEKGRKQKPSKTPAEVVTHVDPEVTLVNHPAPEPAGVTRPSP